LGKSQERLPDHSLSADLSDPFKRSAAKKAQTIHERQRLRIQKNVELQTMRQQEEQAQAAAAKEIIGAAQVVLGTKRAQEQARAQEMGRARQVILEVASKVFALKKGARHGPWKDETWAASAADIHAPRYFDEFEDFGNALQNATGELILRDLLTKELYDKLKNEKTTFGVTLDKCIKGGVDRAILGPDWNSGKVGVLFGDAECVTKFEELMHPVIVARHDNPTLPHPPPNIDGNLLIDHSAIDEKYVISTRIRTGRSISGFPLPPCIGATQRKELEAIVVKALMTLEGDLAGDYYPLAGSKTYEPKPNGIDKETEERLIKDHFLFQEPDEPMLLSWRMERDWPHARGIYHNEMKSALVWVNEEDHLRIISMEKGKNIRAVFDRFANLVHAVEAGCKQVGRGLEVSEKYGNILSCPSNCGTGLRASMMIKIPHASKQPNFRDWCAERKLQARGSGGFASKAEDDGVRDVSNVDRMGKDEVTLVNEMIKGIVDLIAWEKELESKTVAIAVAEASSGVTEAA
jgi:creatine kinase